VDADGVFAANAALNSDIRTFVNKLIHVPRFSTDADSDDLLDQAFQDHEAYTQAIAHRRPLVIGRKGSGKTCISEDYSDPSARRILVRPHVL
jgi:hypothetical protein